MNRLKIEPVSKATAPATFLGEISTLIVWGKTNKTLEKKKTTEQGWDEGRTINFR